MLVFLFALFLSVQTESISFITLDGPYAPAVETRTYRCILGYSMFDFAEHLIVKEEGPWHSLSLLSSDGPVRVPLSLESPQAFLANCILQAHACFTGERLMAQVGVHEETSIYDSRVWLGNNAVDLVVLLYLPDIHEDFKQVRISLGTCRIPPSQNKHLIL